MNKKADIKIPIEVIIGLAFVVIVLLFVFLPFFSGVYNYFFGIKITELSQNNFDRLASTVKEVVDSEDINLSSDVFSFDDTAVIVGFSKRCSFLDNDPACPLADETYLSKSKKCSQTNSCLCLFDAKKLDKDALKCVSLGEDFDLKNNVIYGSSFRTKEVFVSDQNNVVDVKYA